MLDTPATTVGPADTVLVDGVPLPTRERTRLWLYHKPKGLVTSARDPQGRKTVFEALPPALPRVVSVGRLDINTEGLLLITNDGGLARVLELPSTGWVRRYRVRVHGTVDQAMLDGLQSGITVEGVRYREIEARLERVQGSNAWISMALREGKNREVKKVLAALGLSVTRLIRVSYGPFQLSQLAEGAVEEVKARVLADQLGERLIAESGAMIETPDQASRRMAAERPVPKADTPDKPARRRKPHARKPEDREPPGREPQGRKPQSRNPKSRKQDEAAPAKTRPSRPAPHAHRRRPS
ncbi:MAG: pseudouridine synthase [Rhodobiaceae bacterium]|nr:pseudouridine synthase [Rhodobiaceae bacterium]